MESHITDLIKKSLIHFDNQNNKYNKYLKEKRIDTEDVEVLGIFNHQTKVFLWSWALPYVKTDKTIISRELLNYGLKLDPGSNTVSHFFIKTLLVNARNYIDSDFDLELIQAISSYILKDKFLFIKTYNTYDINKKIIITTYYLIKNI